MVLHHLCLKASQLFFSLYGMNAIVSTGQLCSSGCTYESLSKVTEGVISIEPPSWYTKNKLMKLTLEHGQPCIVVLFLTATAKVSYEAIPRLFFTIQLISNIRPLVFLIKLMWLPRTAVDKVKEKNVITRYVHAMWHGVTITATRTCSNSKNIINACLTERQQYSSNFLHQIKITDYPTCQNFVSSNICTIWHVNADMYVWSLYMYACM